MSVDGPSYENQRELEALWRRTYERRSDVQTGFQLRFVDVERRLSIQRHRRRVRWRGDRCAVCYDAQRAMRSRRCMLHPGIVRMHCLDKAEARYDQYEENRRPLLEHRSFELALGPHAGNWQ